MIAVTAGGVLRPLGPEASLTRPLWKPVGTVEQTPTGRVYTTDRPASPVIAPAQATLRWVVRGVSPLDADQELADLVALLDAATRLHDGEAYLSVLRLAESPEPVMGFARLSWRGEHRYDLVDALWTQPEGTRTRTPLAPSETP